MITWASLLSTRACCQSNLITRTLHRLIFTDLSAFIAEQGALLSPIIGHWLPIPYNNSKGSSRLWCTSAPLMSGIQHQWTGSPSILHVCQSPWFPARVIMVPLDWLTLRGGCHYYWHPASDITTSPVSCIAGKQQHGREQTVGATILCYLKSIGSSSAKKKQVILNTCKSWHYLHSKPPQRCHC